MGDDQGRASPFARLRLVLVRTQGPVNLGLIGRLCGNFGVDDLVLVDPQCASDDADVRRFANKAYHRIEQARRCTGLAEAVADCSAVLGTSARPRDGGLHRFLSPAGLPDWAADRTGRLALVFGNEAHGLADAELAHCQAALHLPMPGDYPSFNLSHAVALSLGALQTPQAAPAAASEPAASREEVAALTRYWLGSLERFNYFRHQDREAWSARFDAMLRRLPLRPDDVRVLRAGLAQFNYMHFGDKAAGMASTGRAPAAGIQERNDE